MNITVVAPSQIPSRKANTIQVMKMSQAMVVLGHQVKLISPAETHHIEIPPRWEEIAFHYGIQHEFHLDWIPCRSSLRRYDFSLMAFFQARKWNTDLIYTRLPQAAVIASKFNMGTILEMHDIASGTMGPVFFRQFLNSKGAKRLVVITRVLADDLQSLTKSKLAAPFLTIAPDGVDLGRYESLPDLKDARKTLKEKQLLPTSLPADKFIAGYTGHLYHGRGINLILEIAGCAPDITFLLVGGEPKEISKLQQETKNRGLKNVVAIGFVANSELPLFQAACDALLMPYQHRVAASSGGDISRYLSPMKLFEYMACGRVILTSDLPVLQEVLNQKNSVILPSDNINAWVTGLNELRNNPALREKLANQARVDVSLHTWESRANRILRGIPDHDVIATR